MANRGGRKRSRSRRPSAQWRRMDLHLHTPGSSDYQEPDISYLDILRSAELRGLDVIAFTDHNTVAGYGALKKELEQLIFLEELGRINIEEKHRLDEYRRLLDKILLLPGFEFTAMFGFHILGIFPPETEIGFLEHLLLTLGVPGEKLQEGSSTVGATSDVLTAYRIINQAGGIVIAAHVNSSNGVFMRGLDFGGQTRIAYTQDPNLHTLEVTDLEKRGRYTTRRFFDGSKPEYPRQMRCIQGSDAHRIIRESATSKSLGIGDRITEISLDELTFEALEKVLKGNDLSLTRPYRGPANPIDFVQHAREEGESIVQSFHSSLAQRGGYRNRILQDVCAMANGNGGTIYVGVTANPKEAPTGIKEATKAIDQLYTTIANRLSPEPEVTIDSLVSQGQPVVRITVQPGVDAPYALDYNRFYVRDEAETSLAVRDEIVRLVERRLANKAIPQLTTTPPAIIPSGVSTPSAAAIHHTPQPPTPTAPSKPASSQGKSVDPPSTGVEITNTEKRQGTLYHTVHDLRNGNTINNVTRKSARKLWHYAITQVEDSPPNDQKINWQGNMAILDTRSKGDDTWYDLALRQNGEIHYYFGVSDSGLNEDWLNFIEKSRKNSR